MPTMVMSQPPKVLGDTSLRKRQKTKNDNIVAISYMYVGTPKRKFTFYVRERLVYRPNVEVTYEEVFNFLSNVTNDETITLHYSVNGLYVPITTTGQLHTFIRHVHNDPAVFLYVENHDYVWNVTPNENSHKMEKRHPGGATPIGEDRDPYDSMTDEDEEEGGDGNEGDSSQNEDRYSKQQNESEEEPKLTSPLTSNKATVVFAEKILVKDAFEPKPRSADEMQPGNKNGGTSESVAPSNVEPQENPGKEIRLPNKKWTAKQAYNEIKTILTVAHARQKMITAPSEISEKLVLNIWNPDFPLDRQVFKDTVTLLRNSIAVGVVCYYHRLMHKDDPTTDYSAECIEKLSFREPMPVHDHEFLLDFVEGSIIVARDILESVQSLAHLQNEFDYFKKLTALIVEKPNAQDQLPSIHELEDHLKTAVTYAHYGFNILKPFFPPGCECKEAIRIVTLELQKLLCVINNSKQKTCSPQLILETKLFIVESAHKIIRRFTEKECTKHRTIEHAIRCSEISKWESDVSHGYNEWSKLRRESRPNVSETCYEVELQPTAAFSVKLDGAMVETVATTASNKPGNVRRDATPAPTSKNSTAAPPSSPIAKTIAAMENMSTKDKEEVKQSEQTVRKQVNNTAATTKPPTAATNAPTTTTSTGESSGGGAAIISKKMSPELQGMIDKMYKSVPTQHNYVYPAQPKPGAILIPTGGLARCRCSKNCTEFLMEPAYEYMERFNEPRQTVWEKTKQKRFKKN